MKVSKQHMAESRVRILDAASRMFRERGFEKVTVAEVMGEAGMTHGAFYGHFKSKEDLLARSIESVLTGNRLHRATSLADYIGTYLVAEHRDAPSQGCVYAAVGSEVARSSDDARHVMTVGLKHQVAMLAENAPGTTAEERRQSAVAGWCAMVGALMLSRLVDDPQLSDELLNSTKSLFDQSGPSV